MARKIKRSSRRRKYTPGGYKFTPARKVALKKAAMKSAELRSRRKKKITRAVLAGTAVAGVATGAYLGIRHKEYLGDVASGVRKHVPSRAQMKNVAAGIVAVHPGVKEAIMKSNAVSPPAAQQREMRLTKLEGPSTADIMAARDAANHKVTPEEHYEMKRMLADQILDENGIHPDDISDDDYNNLANEAFTEKSVARTLARQSAANRKRRKGSVKDFETAQSEKRKQIIEDFYNAYDDI